MSTENPAHRLTFERASELIEAASDARVLVVGDCMVDHYISGDVSRISPEAPVPVVRVEEERRALGGAGNVAAGVVALGARCRLVAVVGDDDAARESRELLEAEGVDGDDLVADPGRPTTVKSRVLARHQQMLRVDRESDGRLSAEVREELLGRALAHLEWADVVVLVDYDKGVLDDGVGERLLEEARQRDVLSVVDPKLRSFFDFRHASVFKPNGQELAAALGTERPPLSEAELGAVRERLGCDHLLVTLGEEGMVLVSGSTEGRTVIPSEAREVYDVSGAGDTVTAVLSACLASRPPVAEAASLANFAAGLEVSHLGAVPIGRDELLRSLDGEEEPGEEAPAGRAEPGPRPASPQQEGARVQPEGRSDT